MLDYLLGILLLRRLGLAKPLRSFFLIVFALLTIVVLIYTLNLFLTLSERTTSHHVNHNRSVR